MVLGIKPPLNVPNLFDNWYPGKDKTFRSLSSDLLFYLANKK